MDDGPPRKKARTLFRSTEEVDRNTREPSSLVTPVSPPRRVPRSVAHVDEGNGLLPDSTREAACRVIPSPYQLTRIQDLPESLNKDTVTLKDILGNPLIQECWQFNYLHDLDFLMKAFDEDVRALVKVHVVHGFWKTEDGLGLKMQASQYPNVTLRTAYMPEPYGTHHSKMMVIFRHDDMAQVVIHTANMIERDWRNMCQAVWQSPLLPLKQKQHRPTLDPAVGSGERFEVDFLRYLRAYDSKRTVCRPLIERLQRYDFSKIKGALIGSVPGRYSCKAEEEVPWGWPSLRKTLSCVPTSISLEPSIAIEVSSIATLGITSQWLEKTLFDTLRTSKSAPRAAAPKPACKIIFPTADEVRRSLDGYQSGHSIHTKIQTAAQIKQLQYLKPLLYHWAGDGCQHSEIISDLKDAGRKRAAPHIKTYIRFADDSTIDWALITSANISKQAWGEAKNAAGEVRVSSYELGVLFWPDLFEPGAQMVPIFQTDLPPKTKEENVLVGLRMPYDLPMRQYAPNDEPWCATGTYNQPDWMGVTWNT